MSTVKTNASLLLSSVEALRKLAECASVLLSDKEANPKTQISGLLSVGVEEVNPFTGSVSTVLVKAKPADVQAVRGIVQYGLLALTLDAEFAKVVSEHAVFADGDNVTDVHVPASFLSLQANEAFGTLDEYNRICGIEKAEEAIEKAKETKIGLRSSVTGNPFLRK